jgi:hypothetical protein
LFIGCICFGLAAIFFGGSMAALIASINKSLQMSP